MSESTTEQTTTESSSPELQRATLVNKVKELNQAKERHLAIVFPQETGGEVLIFKTPKPMSEGQDSNVEFAGVHPNLGPIVIENSKISKEIDRLILARDSTTTNFENLTKLEPVEYTHKIRTIRPDEQELWNVIFRNSLDMANRRMAEEELQKKVLPQSLDVVNKALEQNQNTTLNEIPRPNLAPPTQTVYPKPTPTSTTNPESTTPPVPLTQTPPVLREAPPPPLDTT